ncbi:MAG: hypothetical protein HY782_21860 [Chloroflexi bacterium]|nr:hypothetical protein [Chloroflexota bacterium]
MEKIGNTPEAQDERAEWVTPAITDYDVEEATLSGPFFPLAPLDGTFGYS